MQLTSIKFSLSSISMVYPYSWSSSRDLRKSRNATQLFTFMSVIISTRSSTAKNIDTINTFFYFVSFWCLFLTTQHVRRTHDRILINDLFKFCWTHAYVGSLVARSYIRWWWAKKINCKSQISFRSGVILWLLIFLCVAQQQQQLYAIHTYPL